MKHSALLKTFGWLLWRDLFSLKATMLDKIFDGVMWSLSSIIVSSFILPAFGITQQFGPLIWVGTIVTMGFFESIYDAQDLVADREGNYYTGYLLTLPLPAWRAFLKMVCAIAINSAFLSVCILPLGKLVLGNLIDLSNFSLVRFIAVFIVSNLLFGCFAIWAYSWAKNPNRFSEVRRRIVNPLWQFGGYQFTWLVLYNTFPRVAILNLANPLTYVFEGMRAAVLGQPGFLPFWLSIVMIALWGAIFFFWAYKWLQKRLDFV